MQRQGYLDDRAGPTPRLRAGGHGWRPARPAGGRAAAVGRTMSAVCLIDVRGGPGGPSVEGDP
jgi:hypothetical protein